MTAKHRVAVAVGTVSVLTAGAFGFGVVVPDAAKAADTPITWFVEANATKPGQRVGHDAGHQNTKGKGHTENVAQVCPARTDAHPSVSTISGAIGCANPGDSISVAAGTFVDNPIVDKAVTITGANSVIDGGGLAATLTVPVGIQTTLQGLVLRNGTVGLATSGDVTLRGAFEIDHNSGDGIQVATGALRTIADRPTLRSTGLVHDNGGNGVSLGVAYSGEPPVISTLLGDLDVFNNGGHGVFVRDDGGTGASDVVMVDNDVYQNGKSGLFAGRANIGSPVDELGNVVPTSRFAQNKFHSNGQNQVVFDGGGANPPFAFAIESPTGACDSGANGIYSYMGSTLGAFAQNGAAVTIRHMQWQGGGTGLMDFGAQSGSTISVAQNCTAITATP